MKQLQYLEIVAASGAESHIYFHSNGLGTSSFNDYDARIQRTGGTTTGTSNQGTLTYYALYDIFGGLQTKFNQPVWIIRTGATQSFPTAACGGCDFGTQIFFGQKNLLFAGLTEYVGYGGGLWGGHSFFYLKIMWVYVLPVQFVFLIYHNT